MKNDIEKIFDFLFVSNQLKTTKRWLNTPQMTEKESSASHSWSLATLVFIFAKELELDDIDLVKSLKLALIHDIVEILVKDVDSHLIARGIVSKEEKYDNELKAILEIKGLLPKRSADEINALWMEYAGGKTRESKFVYALDKIESIIHILSCTKERFDFERFAKDFKLEVFIAEYANEAVRDFPELLPVLKEMQKRLQPLYSGIGAEWKKEYELKETKQSFETEEQVCQVFDFCGVEQILKDTKRFLNTPQMVIKESSADHSWQVALFLMIAADELKMKADMLKCLKMALIHDLPEALAGDTDSSLVYTGQVSKEEKAAKEKKALLDIINLLPKKSGLEIFSLWEEYETKETAEAKLVNAIDKIEGIHEMVCKGGTCFDHPEWIAPHPKKAVVEKCPETIPLYKELLKRLKPMYEEMDWNWKESYDIK